MRALSGSLLAGKLWLMTAAMSNMAKRTLAMWTCLSRPDTPAIAWQTYIAVRKWVIN